MPPVLYLVGTAQPYSTLQSAIDAVILDYLGTLTADVEIRANAGETFTHSNIAHLMDISLLATGGFRLTLAGADPNNPSIADMTNTLSSFFFFFSGGGSYKKYSIRGFKVINQHPAMGHTILGTGTAKDNGSIIERNDIEAPGRMVYGVNSDNPAQTVIVRNNYVHGRDGVYRTVWIFDPAGWGGGAIDFLGNTFRHICQVFNGWGGGVVNYKDNIMQDVDGTGVTAGYIIESEGYNSLATFNANFRSDNNVWFNIVEATAFLYVGATAYTYAQYKALNGQDAVSLTSDPLLTSFSDPHVGVGSPAISAGVANANLGTDAYGYTRSDPPTIGLYEFARAVLYTVGSGKMFSVLQAAWDAMMSDYSFSVTTNVAIELSNGESFTAANDTPVLNTTGTVTGSNRVTVRGQVLVLDTLPELYVTPSGPAGGASAIEIHTRNVTVYGLYCRGADNAGGSQGINDFTGDGLIVDSCKIQVVKNGGGVQMADNSGTSPVTRNCFFIYSGTSDNNRNAILMASDTKAYNNTFVGTAVAAQTDIGIKFRVARSVFDVRGNIFKGLDVGIDATQADTLVGSTLDYNDFFGNVDVGYAIGGASHSTLASWRTYTGQEANSINTDPLLVSATDPHLTAGTPAFEAGIMIAGVTLDIDGETRANPPCIGCDEFFLPEIGGSLLLASYMEPTGGLLV